MSFDRVAMAYATRHPSHPAKLILISTEAAGGTYKFPASNAPRSSSAERRRSHDADRVSVRHRLRIAPASRSLGTFSGMWPRSCPGCARSRAGNHPGIHPQLIAWCFGKKGFDYLEFATCAGTMPALYLLIEVKR